MTQTSAHIRTVHNASTAVGWAGQRALTIDRPEQVGGTGLGYSGGELLLLAIGACYCNDLFREAAKRAMVVKSVDIDVRADWGGDPLRVQHVTVSATVEAEASESDIIDLIRHTDQIAEIPNSLRLGTAVTLADVRAVSELRQQVAGDLLVPHADAVLEMLGTADTSGTTCAVLTPAIKGRLRELAGGQVLEVRADDPSAREDIAAWCRLAGHELVAVVDEMPKYTRYFLSKKRG